MNFKFCLLASVLLISSGIVKNSFAFDLTIRCQLLLHDSNGQERHFYTDYSFDFENGTVTSAEHWADGEHPAKTHRYVSFDSNRVVLYDDDDNQGFIDRHTGEVRLDFKFKIDGVSYTRVVTGKCAKSASEPDTKVF